MPGCVLRASGDLFRPEDFLQGSTLIACNVFHRGERKAQSRSWETSGLTIVVSDAGGNQVSNQIKESIEFLERNKQELIHLRQSEGVESMELDFGVNKENIFVQSIIIPQELIRLAAELRVDVEVSLYPESKDGECPQ